MRHPSGTTPITVGKSALAARAAGLRSWLSGRTVFVVSSAPVLELWAATLDELRPAAREWHVLEVPDGEAAKTAAEAERLWSEMLLRGGKRDSRLIAFGGGSVGDLTGYVAGCFLRGIDYVQLPTTLLAQVDAAIGGKTGVNLPAGKNTVGLFHHPAEVVADTRWLSTLPEPELRSGLLEAVKMAILLDEKLFEELEAGLEGLLAADAEALAPVVAAAARAKIDVVEEDPAEAAGRRLLNFGHTLGHAIESVLDYRRLRHGEAVGYGMLFALRLARRRGLDNAVIRRCIGLLQRCRLPELPTLESEGLVAAMSRDKKARESGLAWALPCDLGRGEVVTGIEQAEIHRELATFLTDPWNLVG